MTGLSIEEYLYMNNELSRPGKVLISSDNHITRSGLRRILESQSSMIVLGEISASNADEVKNYRDRSPDVLLLHLDSNGHEAFALISKAKRHLPGIVVLVMVDLGDDHRARKAMSLGATGIILKTQSPQVLVAFVESHCARETVRIERVKGWSGMRTPSSSDGKANSQSDHTMIEKLTDRERGIVALIATGMKNKEIAERLHISDITVRHHLSNIFTKLRVSDRQKLLILAHQHGLATLALNRNAS